MGGARRGGGEAAEMYESERDVWWDSLSQARVSRHTHSRWQPEHPNPDGPGTYTKRNETTRLSFNSLYCLLKILHARDITRGCCCLLRRRWSSCLRSGTRNGPSNLYTRLAEIYSSRDRADAKSRGSSRHFFFFSYPKFRNYRCGRSYYRILFFFNNHEKYNNPSVYLVNANVFKCWNSWEVT